MHSTTACSRIRACQLARAWALSTSSQPTCSFAQESIRRGRFGPVLARPGNARAGLLPQPFGQQHRALIQPRITQVDRLKLLLPPSSSARSV